MTIVDAHGHATRGRSIPGSLKPYAPSSPAGTMRGIPRTSASRIGIGVEPYRAAIVVSTGPTVNGKTSTVGSRSSARASASVPSFPAEHTSS
jgi:hypothetical protein